MTTNKKLSGINIFQDKHGRSVYYDRIFKKGYLIQDKNIQQYYFYQNRYLFVAIIAILSATYISNYWLIILFSILAIIILEVMFRISYLHHLTVLSNFKPIKKQSNISINKETKNKYLMKVIAFTLLSILLILNVMTTSYDNLMIGFSYLVSACSIVMAVMNFKEFRKCK